MSNKPTLCLDFDGVIHSYTSGWKGAENIVDPPTEGALAFMFLASNHFKLAIYSSRSKDALFEMKCWLAEHVRAYTDEASANKLLEGIEWPLQKPSAFLTIDDRAMTFTGVWPDPQELLKFKPWNKK